jgi:hypothetical protein
VPEPGIVLPRLSLLDDEISHKFTDELRSGPMRSSCGSHELLMQFRLQLNARAGPRR